MVLPEEEKNRRTVPEVGAVGDPDMMHQRRVLYEFEVTELSPFDAFLAQSSQKTVDAINVAAMIAEANGIQTGQPFTFIDIGTGGGELHAKFVRHMSPISQRTPTYYCLVEPGRDHIRKLYGFIGGIRESTSNYEATIVPTEWENFDMDRWQGFDVGGRLEKQFNIAICSHTHYHFDPSRFGELFGKMMDVLKPGGKLYVVARTKEDWAYQFMSKYRPLLTGKPYDDPTIDDADVALQSVPHASRRERIVSPTLRVPFASEPDLAHKIVEFYLRVPWEELPVDIRDDIEATYGGRDWEFSQSDKIIELTKAL